MQQTQYEDIATVSETLDEGTPSPDSEALLPTAGGEEEGAEAPIERVEVSPDFGLSEQEVADRIAAGKVNGSNEVRTKSFWRIFCTNTFTLFNILNVVLVLLVAIHRPTSLT